LNLEDWNIIPITTCNLNTTPPKDVTIKTAGIIEKGY